MRVLIYVLWGLNCLALVPVFKKVHVRYAIIQPALVLALGVMIFFSPARASDIGALVFLVWTLVCNVLACFVKTTSTREELMVRNKHIFHYVYVPVLLLLLAAELVLVIISI